MLASRREKDKDRRCVRLWRRVRLSEFAPQIHFFVCANRRDASSPLGVGCGDAGDALYDALKKEVANHRDVARVWVTKTACMGICPTKGATCARYPNSRIFTEAEASDAPAIYSTANEADQP